MTHSTKSVARYLESFIPLPLDAEHWQAIVQAMDLSPQQARIVELVLRGMGNRQISIAMEIGEPTIATYLQRIFKRTDSRSRMELAMRVLAVSHEVNPKCHCHQER